MKKNLRLLLLAAIFLVFGGNIFANRQIYLTSYDVSYWQTRYEKSQWAQGWEAKAPLGDAELYAYAGWRQIQGDDPTKINTEMPPLGKYFLGLSILVFKNQFFASLVFGALLLLVTFLISRKVIKDLTWSLVPVLLLSLDRLFQEDLLTSMLDLPFSVFIALSFYFLIKGRENPRWYPALTATLAAICATKMYLAGFGLTAVIALYLVFLFLIFRYKDLFWFVISLPAFLVVYFGSYLVYFLNNHSLGDFKYLHFWIRHFARVQVEDYPKFEIWRILLLGKWKTWWGGSGLESVGAWNPLWTLGSLATVFSAFWGLKEKNLPLLVLVIWVVSLLMMYSFGVPYPRYLLPILPAIYILLVFTVKRFVEVKVWKSSRNTKH